MKFMFSARMGRTVTTLLAITFLSGCATLESMSAGQVGCPPSEITISDESFSRGGSKTWVATCRGRQHMCSSLTYDAVGGGGSKQVSCSQMRMNTALRGPRRSARRAEAKAKVERHYNKDTDTESVLGSFQTDKGIKVFLAGSPARAMGTIQVRLQASLMSMAKCDTLTLRVNAKPHALQGAISTQKGPMRQLSGNSDFQWFKPLAGQFPSFAVRACDTVVDFDDAALAQLKKFLVIYSQLAQSGLTPTSGEETPDVSQSL